MNRTIAVMMLFLFSLLAQSEQNKEQFVLKPYTKYFAVLGNAKGVFSIDDGLGCMTVESITFSLPDGTSKPMHVSSVRFGIGAPHGRNDWNALSVSKAWPVDITLKPKAVSKTGSATGCFDMPSDIVSGQYWLYMQISIDDFENHLASTYSATNEYWKLIDVPN